MLNFAGGVRDVRGARAYVPVAPHETVAIDLADGAVLWRRDGIGRPIAATISRLVTLEVEGKGFALRLVDAATGRDVGRATDFGMPNWATEVGTAPDAVDVEASESADGIRLDWRLRRPYRGGAPPSSEIAAQAAEESAGAVVLDPATAHAKLAGETSSAEIRSPKIVKKLGSHAKSQPDVVAIERVEDRLFALKIKNVADKCLVSLEARNALDGVTLWVVPLSQHETTRPMPQRK